ncbi:Rho termination factor N-terminal domain-containing protein [Rhizobium sp. GCM10022189]|uniref:Rho termination factor N-terminal domain-containing protein n=1 Tax=Rhizobium sp. GCM10022189 TaxID=3252654 RepID=UPI00360CB35B
MTRRLVTEAGFYNGEFLKPGQHYEGNDDEAEHAEVTDRLTKDELLAIAADRGVEANADMTKAEIVAAINAKA